ncbi:hypothetical protein [Luteimonas sp. A478]
MTKLDFIQDKAMQLAGQLGDGIRNVPDHAQKWFKAGVAVGAARTGGKVLSRTTRRHPVMTATAAATAMAAAAGLLVYAYRRRKAQEGRSIDGQSKRVEARRTAHGSADGHSTSEQVGQEPGADR